MSVRGRKTLQACNSTKAKLSGASETGRQVRIQKWQKPPGRTVSMLNNGKTFRIIIDDSYRPQSICGKCTPRDPNFSIINALGPVVIPQERVPTMRMLTPRRVANLGEQPPISVRHEGKNARFAGDCGAPPNTLGMEKTQCSSAKRVINDLTRMLQPVRGG